DADHRQAFVGHAAQRLAVDHPGDSDDLRLRGPQRAADSGDRQDRTDADDRIRGGEQYRITALYEIDHTWRRFRVFRSDWGKTMSFHVCAIPHPPLLKMDRATFARVLWIGHNNMCFTPVVGCRDQFHAWLP